MSDLIRVTRGDDTADIRPDWLADWQAQGWDVPAAPAIPTREDIAKMPKAEVIEWLQAHGVENPEGSVAELRSALVAAMFLDA